MAIVPIPAACVNCGSSGGGGSCECDFVLQEVLCDISVDPEVPFLRHYRYGPTGMLISATDTDLDGTTPFVAGEAGTCSTPTTVTGTICISDCGGSITVDDGGLSLTVDGTVELGAATLAALETVTALQGTSPWVVGDGGSSITVDGTVCIDDCGGSITVDDGGGSITVDGAVTALQGTSPWVVSGTVTSDVTFDYPEDSPHVSGDVGAFVLAVRNDAHAVLTSTDGDYSPLSVDSSGALNVADNGGSLTVDGTVAATQSGPWTVTANQGTSPWVIGDGGGSITVDGTVAVTQGTSPWVVSGTVTADTELPAASALSDADPNPTTSRIGSNALVFNGTTWDRTREATSDAMPVTGLQAAPAMVFNGATWDRKRSGTSIGSTLISAEKAEDSAHASGQTGIFVLGVRNDLSAVLTDTDLDYSPIAVDSSGRVQIVGTVTAVPSGTTLVAGTARDDTDAQATVTTGLVGVVNRNYVWNGTTWDRHKGANADTLAATGLATAANYIFNGTNWDRVREAPSADGQARLGFAAAAGLLWNGSAWDRQVTAISDTQAATGLTGVGNMNWNGTSWDRWKCNSSDNSNGAGIGAVLGKVVRSGGGLDNIREAHSDAMAIDGIQSSGNMIYNGTTWDRMREATADAMAATGIQAQGNMIFNGTTWDRQRTGSATGSTLVSVAGETIATTSLNAQSTVQNGTTLDHGSMRTHNTIVITTSAGVSAGVVTFQVSQDNVNFFNAVTISTTAASTVYSADVVGAFRYARAAITTVITGGTITATVAGV